MRHAIFATTALASERENMLKQLLAASMAFVAFTVPSTAAAVTIIYPNFNSTAGLQLNGSAASASDGTRKVLRLARSLTFDGGSAFSTNPITLSSDYSFSTRFTFNINSSGGIAPADGFVFAIQTVANNVGSLGGGLGFQGIPKSFGVEFDTFNNGSGDGGSSNHVGFDFNGNIDSTFINTTLPYSLASAADLTAFVDYNGASKLLEMRLSNDGSRPTAALLSATGVDLAAVLQSNQAFVGFTAATGAGFSNHDLVNWEFRDTFDPIASTVPEPTTWAMMIGGFGVVGSSLRRRRRKDFVTCA